MTIDVLIANPTALLTVALFDAVASEAWPEYPQQHLARI